MLLRILYVLINQACCCQWRALLFDIEGDTFESTTTTITQPISNPTQPNASHMYPIWSLLVLRCRGQTTLIIIAYRGGLEPGELPVKWPLTADANVPRFALGPFRLKLRFAIGPPSFSVGFVPLTLLLTVPTDTWTLTQESQWASLTNTRYCETNLSKTTSQSPRRTVRNRVFALHSSIYSWHCTALAMGTSSVEHGLRLAWIFRLKPTLSISLFNPKSN